MKSGHFSNGRGPVDLSCDVRFLANSAHVWRALWLLFTVDLRLTSTADYNAGEDPALCVPVT